jgi:hypothetical protein
MSSGWVHIGGNGLLDKLAQQQISLSVVARTVLTFPSVQSYVEKLKLVVVSQSREFRH